MPTISSFAGSIVPDNTKGSEQQIFVIGRKQANRDLELTKLCDILVDLSAYNSLKYRTWLDVTCTQEQTM